MEPQQPPRQRVSVLGGGNKGLLGARNANNRNIPVRSNNALATPIPSCQVGLAKAKVGVVDTNIKVTQREKHRLLAQAQRREEELPSLVIESNLISIFSSEEIRRMAVCEITNTEQEGLGSVNDPRMGVIDDNGVCATCHKDNFECPGHLGYIRLGRAFLHPLFMRTVIRVLTCCCNSCGGFLLTAGQVRERGLHKKSGEKRLQALEEICKGVHCTRQRDPNVKACHRNPTFLPARLKELKQIIVEHTIEKSGKQEVPMPIETVISILNAISDEDSRLMGFDNGSHPRRMIIEEVVVIPPIARPPVKQDGQIWPDHLTMMYVDLVRYKLALARTTDSGKDERERSEIARYMFWCIDHMINNSDGLYTQGHGKEMMSIHQRIQGKEAVIRGAMMSKRVDFSFRTVLSADTSLKFGEIRVPAVIAKTVTVPMMVNRLNLQEARRLMVEGRVTHITPGGGAFKGCRIQVDDRVRSEVSVQDGDKIDRWLRDGDIVVFDRQPTLSKFSIMAYTAKIGKPLTWGMHLSYTTPHNADFDGDEGTGHVPQSLLSMAEGSEIMHVTQCLMDPRTNKPVFGIVMDGITSAYLMTAPDTVVDADDYGDCVALLTETEQMASLPRRLASHGIPVNSGQALFSILLPEDFFYRKGSVLIVDGVLIQGQINKEHVGTTHGSIIQALYNNYEDGPRRTVSFLTDASFVLNRWLMARGFSVGLRDCLPNEGVNKIVREEMSKLKLQIEALGTAPKDPLEAERYEQRFIGKVNAMRDIGMRIAKENMAPDNAIRVMAGDVGGGAKGALFNVTQISAQLGQQFVKGQRPPKSISGGTRCLPYYEEGDESIEARGFCSSSFVQGLTGPELFMHQWGGREGLMDTALKTAETGHMHHRMAKAMEDMKVAYDGSVRNPIGVVFQFTYGGDGFDPAQLVKVPTKEGSIPFFIDVKAAVSRINIKHGFYPTTAGWNTRQEISDNPEIRIR
jgi:DNA-directed RNA polymerase II subunit RPB1